jgi:Interleukin-like EMT inducer
MPNSMNPDEMATILKFVKNLDEANSSDESKVNFSTFGEATMSKNLNRPEWFDRIRASDFFTPIIRNPVDVFVPNTNTTADPNPVSVTTSIPQIRVRPGDLIDSDLFNLVLQRLESLEQRPGSAFMQLGSLGVNTRTLVALGTGFEETGGIFLDGNPILQNPPIRGINLAVFSPQLVVKFRGGYDTWADQQASPRLVTDLATQAAPGDVIAVVTHDAYQGPLTPEVRQALAAVGGATLSRGFGNARDNGCFIGIVPKDRAQVGFDYLVSLMPQDPISTLLSAQPFVWGVYNTTLKRFVMGGGSSSQATANLNRSLPDRGLEPNLTRDIPEIMPDERSISVVPATLDAEMPVTKLPGLGRSENTALAKIEIANLGALAEADPAKVARALKVELTEAEQLTTLARTLLG